MKNIESRGDPMSDETAEARIDRLVRELGLEPHPEGGFYREVFRSASQVQPRDTRPGRAALTTIFYLLPAGTRGAWHRVSSDEAWHLYEGGPIELTQITPDTDTVTHVRLGPPLQSDGPVHVVPAGAWQRARTLESYALVGCTVGPGFDFEDFEMLDSASPEAAALDRLAAP
jgi:uncharacterized protein